MRALMWIFVGLGVILALIGISQNAILGNQFATLACFCVLLALFMSTREPVKPG